MGSIRQSPIGNANMARNAMPVAQSAIQPPLYTQDNSFGR